MTGTESRSPGCTSGAPAEMIDCGAFVSSSDFVIRIFTVDLPVDQLLTVDQAIAILDAVPAQPRMVKVPLLDAMGLRLAQDVFCDRDYPPFDKALMDGFAVRWSDVAVAGAELTVIDTIAADRSASGPIGLVKRRPS